MEKKVAREVDPVSIEFLFAIFGIENSSTESPFSPNSLLYCSTGTIEHQMKIFWVDILDTLE